VIQHTDKLTAQPLELPKQLTAPIRGSTTNPQQIDQVQAPAKDVGHRLIVEVVMKRCPPAERFLGLADKSAQ